MTKATASNIKTNITIAGVTGSVTPTPADCTTDGGTACVATTAFKAADMTKATASNIKTNITIAGVTGSVTPTPADCTTDGGTACVATNAFKAADMTKTTASNIKTNITIAGVTGSVTPTPADCSLDGSTGCVTTTRYKSADTSAFSDTDIKNGKTVGGISGNIANCSSDGQQSCFVSTSSLYKAANISGLTSSMIQNGLQVAGITGSKMDIRICRNLVDSFDNTTAPAAGGVDMYDTVDDYNGGLSTPPSTPWSSATSTCNNANFTYSSGTQYYATDGLTGVAVTSVNPQGSAKTWTNAIAACKALTWNNIGPNVWRLPTQKELMQLYIDGISRVDSAKMGNLNQYFWTSSTSSELTLNGWAVNPATGVATTSTKLISALNVICVK
jgi:hypothetical protein